MSKTPEILVIFGCKVESWGPSVLLRDRLDTALEYLDGHPGVTVVVTGGKGDDERQSEAQCMYDYLTAHGVDGETILMEDASRNTWQNVNYTLDLLAGKGVFHGRHRGGGVQWISFTADRDAVGARRRRDSGGHTGRRLCPTSPPPCRCSSGSRWPW